MAQKRKFAVVGAGGGKSGGGAARAPVEAPNTLQSKQYARIVDLLSEGEIVGVIDGFKSIYLDGTPIQNADDSYNFSDVVAQWRPGTQSQSYMPGFPSSESTTALGTQVFLATPVVITVNDPSKDAIRVTVSVLALSNQDTTTGDLNGYSIPLRIELQADGGGYVEVLTDTISGKCMSTYQRSYEIPLAGSAPWDIRVKRDDQEAPSANINNRLFVSSYTLIEYVKLTFANSAVVGISIDAAQFSRIPVRAYDVKGLIVKIPSNYDPDTRAYTGVWDGTFTTGWTDNPAWIYYDLLTAGRYGLGDFIDEAQIDKWTLYEIAQYCDELVDDGAGGTEPRFTCNVYLQSAASALSVLSALASVFRGMVYWSGGVIVPVQDAPSDPVALFTNANVIGGDFVREGSSRDARHTVALVTWNDPDNFGKQVIEAIEDREGIARYGLRELPITAFGCTSRGQAYRVGRWALYSERMETQVLHFSVGADGQYVYPGAVIETLDQFRAGARQAGRIAAATTTSIDLDHAATVESGTNTVAVMLPDGTVEERTLTNSPGSASTLTWSTPLSAVPVVGAVWVLTTPSLVPETWRVLSVRESSKGVYDIAALAHNPSKYDAIENGLVLEARPTSLVQAALDPPTGLAVTDYIRRARSGDIVTYLAISWDQEFAAMMGQLKYEVSWRPENGNWTKAVTEQGTYDAEGVRDGVLYEVAVRAFNSITSSLPATATHTPIGKDALPSDVTGFTAVQQGDTVLFGCNGVEDEDLDAVEIRYNDEGVVDWDSASVVTNILRGHTANNGSLPPGTWEVFAKARDTSKNYSQNAAHITLVVTAQGYQELSNVEAAPAWSGTLTNMVRTWDGKLTPASQDIASSLGWEVFDEFVHNPYTDCYYEMAEVDLSIDGATRIFSDIVSAAGPGESSGYVDPAMELDYKIDGGSYDGFEIWKIGNATLRQYKARLHVDTSLGSPVITSFNVVADALPRKESYPDQAIANTGTTLTYAAPFRAAPIVSVTPSGTTPVMPRIENKTTTEVDLYLHDPSTSADVSGTADVTIEGI